MAAARRSAAADDDGIWKRCQRALNNVLQITDSRRGLTIGLELKTCVVESCAPGQRASSKHSTVRNNMFSCAVPDMDDKGKRGQ